MRATTLDQNVLSLDRVFRLRSLAMAVSQFGRMNAGHLHSVEINSLRVLGVGDAVVALDAVTHTK